ncbi:NfeD family protein [Roseateles violae]|uniref:NfeD family protein n=1 Tax=Roseateles violae TaxID=3058042 RepID=A0ABT8DQ76_9BURK|nr:NfeD family protein [Pelomonas sp. PFR6]MDN3920501.1 NfeD family protein [Pelomonas sp. PFR6]
MNWNPATAWWIACGALVAVELATGSFYLLMLALGCAAAALAAHLGAEASAQLLAAALVGGAAVVLWHRRRGRRADVLPPTANPDVNMDVGQAVNVEHWAPDGSASVRYRGAEWRARYLGGDMPPAAGRYVIRAVEGSCLLLDR